jgi:hypothetical protein
VVFVATSPAHSGGTLSRPVSDYTSVKSVAADSPLRRQPMLAVLATRDL